MLDHFDPSTLPRADRVRRAAILHRAIVSVAALVLALMAPCEAAFAQKLTPLPSLSQRVNDNVAMLSDQDESELNALMTRYRAEKGVEVMLLTVASTGSETIDEFGTRLVRSWMAAHPGVNDIVIFVVARDNRPDSNRVYIAAGPKLPLPELVVHRIVEEDVLPRFRVLDYGPGLIAGIERVKSVIAGEPLPVIVEPVRPVPRTRRTSAVLFVIGGAVLVVLALFAIAMRRVRARRMVHLTGRRPLNRSFEPMLVGRIVGRRHPSPTEEDAGNGFGGGFGVVRGPIGAGDFSGGGASGSW